MRVQGPRQKKWLFVPDLWISCIPDGDGVTAEQDKDDRFKKEKQKVTR